MLVSLTLNLLNVRLPIFSILSLLQYTSAGFEYSLEIKWTLNIRPQMEAYDHYSYVSALIVDACKNHLTFSILS